MHNCQWNFAYEWTIKRYIEWNYPVQLLTKAIEFIRLKACLKHLKHVEEWLKAHSLTQTWFVNSFFWDAKPLKIWTGQIFTSPLKNLQFRFAGLRWRNGEECLSFFAEFSIFPRISQTSSHDSPAAAKLQNGTTKGASFKTTAWMFISHNCHLFEHFQIFCLNNLLFCFSAFPGEKTSLQTLWCKISCQSC